MEPEAGPLRGCSVRYSECPLFLAPEPLFFRSIVYLAFFFLRLAIWLNAFARFIFPDFTCFLSLSGMPLVEAMLAPSCVGWYSSGSASLTQVEGKIHPF